MACYETALGRVWALKDTDHFFKTVIPAQAGISSKMV
jgi:hypothetical protein